MAHYTLKQGGRVLNVIPNALHMNDDVDERACCVVVQQCCCVSCLLSAGHIYELCTYCIAWCIANMSLLSQKSEQNQLTKQEMETLQDLVMNTPRERNHIAENDSIPQV